MTWSPPKFFYHPKGDGTLVVVDASGVPLKSQPPFTRTVSSGAEHVQDPWENKVERYTLPTDYLVHRDPVLGPVAVDANGVPLPSQPPFQTVIDESGSEVYLVKDGSQYSPPPFYPPPGDPPEEWPPSGGETAGGSENEMFAETVEPEEALASDPGDAMEDLLIAGLEGPGGTAPGEATTDASTEADDATRPVIEGEDVPDDPSVVPQGDTEDASPPPADESMRSYTGVLHEEGEVLVDDDWSEGESREQEVSTEQVSEQLLTAGLNDSISGDGEVSATPITLPGEEMPVGDGEVSATPITLPGEEMPVGGEEMPVGGEEVSVLPIPVPEPPAAREAGDGHVTLDDKGEMIALDRKGDDGPVGIGDEGAPTADDVEFHVAVVEGAQFEEVRLEEVEPLTVEWDEPMTEGEVVALEEEDVEELDG